MSEPYSKLERLGTLHVSGPDARTFLQGQLSADIERLSRTQVMPASFNSAQGRVQAVVWLVERVDAIVMILPAMLVDATVTRLRKYVLRAKVQVASGQAHLRVYAKGCESIPEGLDAIRAHREVAGASYIRWPGVPARILTLMADRDDAAGDETTGLAWRLADIRAGLPQVYPETQEAFVAQMLNLDLIGGIDYEKGCYTGQEIIARTHFRGTIKRRMLRFAANAPPPSPGTRIVAGNQHAGDVVDAAPTSDGCELLAVVNLTHAAADLAIDAHPGGSLRRLPLPYAVTAGPE